MIHTARYPARFRSNPPCMANIHSSTPKRGWMIRSLWNVNKSRGFTHASFTWCRIFVDVAIRVAWGLGMKTDGGNAYVGLYVEGRELFADTLLVMCQYLVSVLVSIYFNVYLFLADVSEKFIFRNNFLKDFETFHQMWHLSSPSMFSLNSTDSVTKIFGITVKRLDPATTCVRDQDATIEPARHMWETVSLNWLQFMFKWFIRFPKFTELLFDLEKTPKHAF